MLMFFVYIRTHLDAGRPRRRLVFYIHLEDVALGEIIHTRIKCNFIGPILTRRFMEADDSKLGSVLQ